MAKKILIVEDDESIQDVLKIILKSAGYQTSSFLSGTPIMQDQYEKPDLFLLDKQLSGVDGLDICTRLKANAETKNIPVIMISANPQIAELSKEAGANDYIEKPFTMEDLLQKIRNQMEHSADVVQ